MRREAPPGPDTAPFLPLQTPLQESLIELSDSSLNKMATDMFLGVWVGWNRGQAPGTSWDPAPHDPAYPTPLVLSLPPPLNSDLGPH